MDKIRDLLESNTWGTLSIIDNEKRPYAFPMSYVVYYDKVYFHTGPHAIISHMLDREICFTTAEELSFIPGSWMTVSGNPGIGTVFYRSLMITDKPEVVTNLEKKSEILNHLSERFEPGGEYKKIYPTNLALKNIIIWSFPVIKAKYRERIGENLSKKVQARIIDNLLKRGSSLDQRTAKLVQSLSL